MFIYSLVFSEVVERVVVLVIVIPSTYSIAP